MSLVRSILLAAVATQLTLLAFAAVSVRSVRLRFMRVGILLGITATTLLTAVALASHWTDRTYDVSEYLLIALTFGLAVAESTGVAFLLRYIRTQQTHDDQLRVATDELLEHRDELQRSRDFYLQLFDDFPALIWRANTSAQCDYFNRAWLDFRGKTTEQEWGDGWVSGVHPDDVDRCVSIWLGAFEKRRPFEMEYRLQNAQNEYRWIADYGRPFFGTEDEFLGYIGSCYDITESKEQAEQLSYMAHHDGLTGLANRRVLQVALERAFALAQRDVSSILLYIDVDHFKSINDRLGHSAGDAILIAVARILNEGVRATDVVARLGGDEFAVLLERIDTDGAVAIAQRLVDAAREDLSDTGLSIGVAGMADAADITEVMRRADECMYEAKSGGGSRVVVDIRATHAV